MGIKNDVAKKFEQTLKELPREKLEQHFLLTISLISCITVDMQITAVLSLPDPIERLIAFAAFMSADSAALIGTPKENEAFVETCGFLVENLTNSEKVKASLDAAAKKCNAYKN